MGYNQRFNVDLAAGCQFKICWLIEIPSFNYIPNQKGQAG